MDSFELAKIAGAVLCALLVIVGLRTALQIAEMNQSEGPTGFTLPMPQAEAPSDLPADGAAAVPAPVGLPAIPPSFNADEVAEAAAGADAEAGANVFKKCVACHSVNQGGANKVGPNLWGIVGRAKAGGEGFKYSEALKSKGGEWTLTDLAAFLHNPKEYTPGTKMIFPGISDSTDLSDLLAYLNTLK